MALTTGAAMTAAAIASAAAATVSAVGSIVAGRQQSKIATGQAEASRLQGEIANEQAKAQAAEISQEATRTRATQIAQAANAGIDLSSTSFQSIVNSSMSKAQAEQESVIRAGKLSQANYLSEASAFQAKGSAAKTQSYFTAGATLLKGAGSTMAMGKEAGWFN